MKTLLIAATALTILASPLAALAQPDRHDDRNNAMMQHQDDHHGGPAMMMKGPAHHDWHKGDRFDRNDWNRYERVDYRRYHLKAPPRGYEWRRVDNNFILAAAATGLVASIIAASN
jgi:Ni/Co efflux regulator RcnB